jgi:hypothetical protein
MRKVLVLLAVAAAALATLPAAGEACWRRRCPPPCPPAPCYFPPAVAVIPPTVAPPVAPRTVSIDGINYMVEPIPEPFDYKVDEMAHPPGGGGATPLGFDPNNSFNGKARAAAKTTIVPNVPVVPVASVSALIATLTPDADMQAMNIDRGAASKRVDVEKRNVSVKAYIYAYRKESDNDFHVIIGDAPTVANRKYLNSEVSGLPLGGTADNLNRLTAVRHLFTSKFHSAGSGATTYHKVTPPAPVLVTGSLFFDVEHPSPHFVGPTAFKPKTAWEIHPISDLKFHP